MLMFGRYLRFNAGFRIDLESLIEALSAIEYIDIGSHEEFRQVLKSILCQNKKQWIEFDEHYETFWKMLQRALDSKEKSSLDEKVLQQKKNYSIESIKSWLYQNDEKDDQQVLDTSMRGIGSSEEFAQISIDEEHQLISELIKKWYVQESTTSSRRKVSHFRKGMLDLRKIIEQSAKGRDFELRYKYPKQKEISIVVLFDASRSMSMYQAFFISLIKSITHHFPISYTYGFHTELVETNEMFDLYDYDHTIKELEKIRGLYHSGTKIGACLRTYIDNHSSEQINTNTLVLIISDGWDTGTPEVLTESMAYLHYRSKKLFWFNPIVQSENTQLPQGLEVILPFIDQLKCIYSTQTLRRFIDNLA